MHRQKRGAFRPENGFGRSVTVIMSTIATGQPSSSLPWARRHARVDHRLVRRPSPKCNADRAVGRRAGFQVARLSTAGRVPQRGKTMKSGLLTTPPRRHAGMAGQCRDGCQDLQLLFDRRIKALEEIQGGSSTCAARRSRPPATGIPAQRRWNSPAASPMPRPATGCRSRQGGGDGQGQDHPAALAAVRPRRSRCHT